MMTRIQDRPSVSGTNRKWYSAVTANCSRDRSTTSAEGIRGLRERGGSEHLLLDAQRIHRHLRRRRRTEKGIPENSENDRLDGKYHDDVASERGEAAARRGSGGGGAVRNGKNSCWRRLGRARAAALA